MCFINYSLSKMKECAGGCFSLQRNKVFSISKSACPLVASMLRSVDDVNLKLMCDFSIHYTLAEYISFA